MKSTNDQRGLSVCYGDGSCIYWLFYRVKRDASAAWKFKRFAWQNNRKILSAQGRFISSWMYISITSSRTGRIIFWNFSFLIFMMILKLVPHIERLFPLRWCYRSASRSRLCVCVQEYATTIVCLYWGLSIMKWCNECAYRNHFS